MIPLPSPLHPAVVHFPIALLMIGAPVAVLAIFLRRWHLPWLAAIMLVLGAAGTMVAVATGEQEGEMVESGSQALEQVLEMHEEFGEMTRNVAIVAAVLAVAAAFSSRVRIAGRGLSVLAAVAAAAAAYYVAETGHYGGQLVYRHGAGINLSAVPTATDTSPSGTAVIPRGDHEDDD